MYCPLANIHVLAGLSLIIVRLFGVQNLCGIDVVDPGRWDFYEIVDYCNSGLEISDCRIPCSTPPFCLEAYASPHEKSTTSPLRFRLWILFAGVILSSSFFIADVSNTLWLYCMLFSKASIIFEKLPHDDSSDYLDTDLN